MTMTILLTPLSNNARQDAAGSLRPAQLWELTVFIDIWQRPSMIVYFSFFAVKDFLVFFFQILIV